MAGRTAKETGCLLGLSIYSKVATLKYFLALGAKELKCILTKSQTVTFVTKPINATLYLLILNTIAKKAVVSTETI